MSLCLCVSVSLSIIRREVMEEKERKRVCVSARAWPVSQSAGTSSPGALQLILRISRVTRDHRLEHLQSNLDRNAAELQRLKVSCPCARGPIHSALTSSPDPVIAHAYMYMCVYAYVSPPHLITLAPMAWVFCCLHFCFAVLQRRRDTQQAASALASDSVRSARLAAAEAFDLYMMAWALLDR